jgi:prepilin-type N-terminal cleavage/methylation domain-containing protein
MKTLKNSKGFTLIEIIAVLVILGILAAVAVPKYVDMADQAKKSAAIGQVAEIKSALNLGYSKLYLSNGAAPATAAAVITAAGLTSGDNTMGTSPDVWVVTVTGASNKATIAVKSRDGDLKYNGTGAWYIPVSE